MKKFQISYMTEYGICFKEKKAKSFDLLKLTKKQKENLINIYEWDKIQLQYKQKDLIEIEEFKN
jgi:hypothetical protein